MTTALPRTIDYVVANGDLATGDIGQDRVPSLSADGRWLAFTTVAALVPEDTNGVVDVYLKDFATGAVTRVSTGSGGVQGNGASSWASLSPDGTRLLFMSAANNLVPNDTNGAVDVFLKDLATDATQRVSTTASGAQTVGGPCEEGMPSFSPDGRKVLFVSVASNLVPGDTNNTDDVFIKDLDTGAVQRVSAGPNGVPQGNAWSQYPSFDFSGEQFVFESDASNFFAGDTNNAIDVFIRDIELDFLFPVSTSSTGALGNGDSEQALFSPDGRYVYFTSIADNLVAGDTNGRWDIFRKDPFTDETIRVSVAADGSQATGGSGIFGIAEMSGSWLCDISGDGRYLVFASDATNLVAGDTNGVFDIFVKDLESGAVARASTDAAGVQANDFPFLAAMSADGRYIAFESLATNLVAGDANGLSDYFRVPNPFLSGAVVPGSSASDNLTGSGSIELLSGLGGDDTLWGLGGDDNLDGGSGIDTAAYAGASGSFRIAHKGANWEVEDKSPAEGRDALVAVERLQFADKSFELVNPPRQGVPVYNTSSGFLFDAVYYLLDNPELVPTQNITTALAHYFATGAAQGKAPSSWFDATWYENRWPDLTPYRFDDATLFMHYNLYGVWEGRSAGPEFDQFDGNRYLNDNPDVAAYVDAHLPDFLGSRSNGAIAHYVIYGQHELRPAFDLVGQPIDLGYTVDLGG